MSQRDDTLKAIFDTMGVMKRTMHGYFLHTYEKLHLSPAQVELLFTIHFSEPVSHKELANKLQLTPGAISQLLDVLDQAGYIIRTPSKSDRRVNYVSISSTGQQIIDKFAKTRQAIFTEALATLSDQELAVYLQVQRKMLAYFESRRKDYATPKQKEL